MLPSHCMTYVADLDRSIRFYEQLLGYRVADRHAYSGHRLVYLRAPEGGFEIELIETDAGSPLPEKVPQPSWHLAFTVDDLEGEFARVEKLGGRMDSIADYRANGKLMTRYFYCYDPDGNQIEFLQSFGRYAMPKRNEKKEQPQ